jgi:predicted 3-demethylubiquinone-9 3-methyltransferase (glyoxalase superfamily)
VPGFSGTRQELAMPEITTFLTYDHHAEDAVRFYLSVFEDGKILDTLRHGEAGPGTKGSVLTVTFELLGKTYVAMNGGPSFTFTHGISLSVSCDTQAEVDRFWSKLSSGGKEVACGWLVDKYGVSWQIVPKCLPEMLADKDPVKATRTMKAMMKMVKLDIGALKKAYAGD